MANFEFAAQIMVHAPGAFAWTHALRLTIAP